jgi:hypothetical protein
VAIVLKPEHYEVATVQNYIGTRLILARTAGFSPRTPRTAKYAKKDQHQAASFLVFLAFLASLGVLGEKFTAYTGVWIFLWIA